MADFAILVASDPARRRRFLDRAREAVSRQPGLVAGTAELGDLAAAWAHGPQAPVSIRYDSGSLALLLGHAIPDEGPRLSAEDLGRSWLATSPAPTACDGYFAAVAWRPATGLAVGSDPFGLFPIYVRQGGEDLVVASTPELAMLAHGGCSPGHCDPEGLAGILLTNGLLGGRSLTPGVRRLSAGHGLRWTADRGPEEVVLHELTAHDEFSRLDQREADDLVDAELRRAIGRHRPAAAAGIMLSGGLDSRLMAAYLATESAVDRALTLGRRDDFDARAAGSVAAVLGIADWTVAEDIEVGSVTVAARRLARTERLAGGFAGLETDPEARFVARMSPEFWSGFAADDLLGGYAARFGRNPAGRRWSADTFLTRIGRWGLPPDVTGRLLQSAGGREIVAAIRSEFQREYDAGPGADFQRSFRMKLATRVRFHIGSIVHRISFHSWPLLPVLDRRLVNVVFNLPFDHVASRQLEIRLLARRAPRLMDVPRDTNSFGFEPVPSPGRTGWGGLAAARASLWRKLRRAYWRRWRRTEPRRYVRRFDLDTAIWRAVRQAAEPGRNRLPDWIDRPTFDGIVPPADALIGGRDPFAAGTRVRILTGLALLHASG